MAASLAVVVSFYSERSVEPLAQLIQQILSLGVRPLVVINQAESTEWRTLQSIKQCNLVERINTGMNIGAWLHGIRQVDADAYICLQDECSLVTHTSIHTYEQLILNTPRVGLWGETLNVRWSRPWATLMSAAVGDVTLQERARLYASKLDRFGLPRVEHAGHLRSLVWGFDRETAELLKTLPDGTTKNDCVALEIGASQLVMAKGRKIAQSADEPFRYFRHQEWREDGLSKREEYAS